MLLSTIDPGDFASAGPAEAFGVPYRQPGQIDKLHRMKD
jgi:hypothetical protein